jgi:SecD/SecF fusion protein
MTGMQKKHAEFCILKQRLILRINFLNSPQFFLSFMQKNNTMSNTWLLIVLLSASFLVGCAQNTDKTEIKIQLSEVEYLYALTGYTKDSAFLVAYHLTQKNYNPEKDEFISLFERVLLEIDPEIRLAAYYGTFEFRDKINYNSTNQEVIAVLKEDIKLALENTIMVLKNRIESALKTSFFTVDSKEKPVVEIRNLAEKNTYLFTINRKVDKTHLKKLLESQIDFGFWETYNLYYIWQYVVEANNKIKENLMAANGEYTSAIQNISIKIDKNNPLFSILIPSFSIDGKATAGDLIGVSCLKDTALVNKYLAILDVKNSLPRDLRLMWKTEPRNSSRDSVSLIAIKISNRDGSAVLNGDCIEEAETREAKSKDQSVLRLKFNSDGARILSRMTSANIDEQIAVVCNNVVYYNLTVNSEIRDGTIDISGNYTPEEVNDLAILLNSGNLPKILVKATSVNE